MTRATMRYIAFLVMAGTLFPSNAHAADVSIGARIADIIGTTFGPVMVLITLVCTLIGLVLFASGLMKLIEMSNGQYRREGTSSIFVTLAASACLLVLPEAAGIGMTSMVGNSSFLGSSDLREISAQIDDPNGGAAQANSVSARVGAMAQFAPPENCMNQPDAVPCMAGNLAKNVVPVGVFGAFIFAILCGLWIFASCLMAVSKAVGQGQGLPQGIGVKFIGAILLLNSPFLFGIISNTIFGYGEMSINSLEGTLNSEAQMLSYSTNTQSAALEKYEDLIGHVFVILALFGVVAFVRGIMVVMAAGEGRQQAGMGQGTVYILAGILMANSKLTTCFILSTMGVATAGGIGFCG